MASGSQSARRHLESAPLHPTALPSRHREPIPPVASPRGGGGGRAGGNSTARRSHLGTAVGGAAPAPYDPTHALLYPERPDMISHKWTPVERNTVWREHVKKEQAHRKVRTAYTRDPRTLVMVTDKPNHRVWPASDGSVTRRGDSLLPPSTLAPHVLSPRRQAKATPMLSPLAPRVTAGKTHSSDEKEAMPVAAAVIGTASVVPGLPLTQLEGTSHDSMLTALKQSELTPRDRFAFPATSSHEYGWDLSAAVPVLTAVHLPVGCDYVLICCGAASVG